MTHQELETEASCLVRQYSGKGHYMHYPFDQCYSRLSAIIEGGNPPPHELEIQPSSHCDAHCAHYWGGDYPCLPNRLCEPQHMERVMGQALSFTKGGFGIDSIKFCGTTGEPLTNPQVLSAIEMARGRCSLTLFTNGLLMARHAADRRCLAIIAGVNRLNVSLDAASAVTLHEVKPGAANITWRRW